MLAMNWEPLPVAVGVVVLSIAAVSQAYARRVPNVLTLPAILAGWAYSLHIDVASHAMWPGPAFQASFIGSFAALLIMLPFYRIHSLGAGCVKSQTAFGAWMGCALPLLPSLALTARATVTSLMFTYFVAIRVAAGKSPNEERSHYEFPAQITITIVTAVSVLACWIVSYST